MPLYLGDGVFVEYGEHEELGSMLKLTTTDGYENTNTIYLEPEVWANLLAYVKTTPLGDIGRQLGSREGL